jgi:DNA-binding response OmpR family regulator
MNGVGTPSSDRLGKAEASLGNLTINYDSYRVWVDQRLVRLTYQEFEMLRLFLADIDRIIPYTTLAAAILGESSPQHIRRLNIKVHRLRVKLSGMSPYTIQTVRERGYGLIPTSDRTGPSAQAEVSSLDLTEGGMTP